MFHQSAECARNVRSATKRKNPSGTLVVPRGFPEERGAAVCLIQLLTARLSFSTAHVPNTWEVEAEKGRQMGEANRNFSVLFSSLGNK